MINLHEKILFIIPRLCINQCCIAKFFRAGYTIKIIFPICNRNLHLAP